MSLSAKEHKLSPGSWPKEMPVGQDGRVEEGLVVWSLSGSIEGRRVRGFAVCPSGVPGGSVAVGVLQPAYERPTARRVSDRHLFIDLQDHGSGR